jgi:hypothetical protein
MTEELGCAGLSATNAGEDLVGLGIGWFSPRSLPLNTTSSNFTTSRNNSARNTTHAQLHALSRINSTFSTNGRRTAGQQIVSRQHQRAAAVPTHTTGHRALLHNGRRPLEAAGSTPGHTCPSSDCCWDKPRPVPEAHADPSQIDLNSLSKVSGARYSTGHCSTGPHSLSGLSGMSGLASAVPARYWTSSRFAGFPTSTLQLQHQQLQHQTPLPLHAPFLHLDSAFPSGRGASRSVGGGGSSGSSGSSSRSGFQLGTAPAQATAPAAPAIVAASQNIPAINPAVTTSASGYQHFTKSPHISHLHQQQHQYLHHHSPVSSSFVSCLPGCTSYAQGPLTTHGVPTPSSDSLVVSSLPLSLEYSTTMATSFPDDNDELARMQELSNGWEPEASVSPTID